MCSYIYLYKYIYNVHKYVMGLNEELFLQLLTVERKDELFIVKKYVKIAQWRLKIPSWLCLLYMYKYSMCVY